MDIGVQQYKYLDAPVQLSNGSALLYTKTNLLGWGSDIFCPRNFLR